MHVTQVRVPYKCTSKIVYTAYNAIYAGYYYIQTAQTVLIFTAIFWNHQLFLWPQIANNVVADSLARNLVFVQILQWGDCCNASLPHICLCSIAHLSLDQAHQSPHAEYISQDTYWEYCWKSSTSHRIALLQRLASLARPPGCPLDYLKRTTSFSWCTLILYGSSEIYFSNIGYNQLCCSYFLVNFFLFILPLIYKLVTLLVHKRRSESMGIYLYLQYYLFIQFIVLIGYHCSE